MALKFFVLFGIVLNSKVNANLSVSKEFKEFTFELKLKELEGKLEKQEVMMNSFDNRLKVCEKEKASILSSNPAISEGSFSNSNRRPYGQHAYNRSDTSRFSPSAASFLNHETVSHIRQERQVAHKVAFSVYLNSRISNLGPDQIIQFAGVNLNEGNAYNRYTGVFTTPYSGVYLFTFVAEDSQNHRLWLKLVVNGSLRSSLRIYPYSSGYYAMGSNTVILRLTVGQSVWIAVNSNEYGDYLDGSSSWRVTTFSGVFLYQ